MHQSQHNIVRFPPQLVDQIVAHLHLDKASLKCYSQVSHTWLHFTRRHLFHTIVVHGTTQPAHGYPKFLHFLPSNSQIGAYIQNLSLQGDGCVSACKHEISDVLSHLPCLQKLEISGVEFGSCAGVGCHGRDFDDPKPISLGALTLAAGSDSDSFQDTINILRLFDEIGHFHLNKLAWSITDMLDLGEFEKLLSDRRSSLHLGIRALVVDHSYTPSVTLFCQMLRFTPSVQTLSSISAECATWDYVESLGDLIHDVSPNLHQFRLDVSLILSDDMLFSTDPLRWQSLALSSCPNLESISLMLHLEDLPYMDDLSPEEKLYACTNVLDILSTTSNIQSLRHITFQLSFKPDQDAVHVNVSQVLSERIDWERMEKLMGGFASLEKITFVFVDGAVVLEECRPVVLRKLQQLDHQGLLEMVVSNEGTLSP